MDSLISASAHALARGDPLGALQRVALREDPPALALRGIAMAQLGEHPRARELLRRAARGFDETREALARARCVVAEAEIALAMRELDAAPPRALLAALRTLEQHGDRANALHARLIAVRRLLLIGRLAEAAGMLAPLLDEARLPPPLAAVAALAEAELALRSLDTARAAGALARALDAARRAGIAALQAEAEEAAAALRRPAARCPDGRLLTLPEVEALLACDALVVDGCRRGIASGAGRGWLPLARRPLLFALASELAAAWPGDVGREALIERLFRLREPDETHRARLRVEIGRLRALLKATGAAAIEATPRGYALRAERLVLLLPPIADENAALLALLADGAGWSTSALALALDASQRTVQRMLAELQAQQRVRSVGRARSQRWLAAPLAHFTTILLLPATLPTD